MNSGKSFLSCNWLVFMKEVCRTLGFKTEESLKYAKRGSDHHKMGQILEVTYLAMADELLLPYVRDCVIKRINPSVEGYLTTYNDAVRNPNYEYAQLMTFTFLHSMMMLRKGVRSGQHLPILAAKSKLSLLFFGRNHPLYQYMLFQDFRIECLMPDQVREIVYSLMSSSRNNSGGHYQSGDAHVEEINKKAKKWVIGVPTHAQWIQSFRNLDKLDTIRKNTLDEIGLKDETESLHLDRKDIANEVLHIRMLFRGYFKNPTVVTEHKDISGKIILSNTLKDFYHIALENYKDCIQKLESGQQIKPNIVFVTHDELTGYSRIDKKNNSRYNKRNL